MLHVYPYTKFFSSIHKAVEPPVVSVSETGSRVDKTPYTLTCRVTLPSGVHVESESINIQWLISTKVKNSTLTPSIVYNSDGSYTVNLTFNHLKEGDNGNYTCRANYSLSIFLSPVVSSNVSTLNVIPKSKYTSCSVNVHDLYVSSYRMPHFIFSLFHTSY